MKFVLVNGRMPARQNYCVWCCTPICAGYLRDITTRLCYCDHQCYQLYRDNSALLLGGSADRESRGFAAHWCRDSSVV